MGGCSAFLRGATPKFFRVWCFFRGQYYFISQFTFSILEMKQMCSQSAAELQSQRFPWILVFREEQHCQPPFPAPQDALEKPLMPPAC